TSAATAIRCGYTSKCSTYLTATVSLRPIRKSEPPISAKFFPKTSTDFRDLAWVNSAYVLLFSGGWNQATEPKPARQIVAPSSTAPPPSGHPYAWLDLVGLQDVGLCASSVPSQGRIYPRAFGWYR